MINMAADGQPTAHVKKWCHDVVMWSLQYGSHGFYPQVRPIYPQVRPKSLTLVRAAQHYRKDYLTPNLSKVCFITRLAVISVGAAWHGPIACIDQSRHTEVRRTITLQPYDWWAGVANWPQRNHIKQIQLALPLLLIGCTSTAGADIYLRPVHNWNHADTISEAYVTPAKSLKSYPPKLLYYTPNL